MSNISFTAHGRCARATYCEPITTGSVGLTVSFAFDAAWSGLQKTAIFRGSGMAVDLVLSGEAATVPPEVLTIPGGDLRVGVWGADPEGNVIIPTVWATVGEIVPGAAPSGFDPDPPTPSWAAQVQEIAQDALNTANGVREDADAGAFDGATYTPAVSAGGDLSWTNDKGKPNPPTVNIKGPEGQPGQTGATPDISIGTVETLPPGSPATATITGTAENPVLSFGIPQGQQGAPGEVTQAEFDELAGEVADQKSAIESLDALVDRKAGMLVDTASGAIASFVPDATIDHLLGLDVAVEPVQDLHGYDNPWPAGCGKNKAKLSNSNLGNGQRNNVTYSDSGATVSAAGTYSRQGWLIPVVQGQTYTFSFKGVSANNVGNGYQSRCYLADRDAVWGPLSDGYISYFQIKTSLASYSYTFTASSNVFFFGVYVTTTNTDGSITVSDVQLELGSTATAWAPFENLCAISGWSAVGIEASSINAWDEEWLNGYLGNSGAFIADASSICAKNFITVHPGQTMYVVVPSGTSAQICAYAVDGTYLERINVANAVYTVPNNAYKIRFSIYGYGTTYNHDISINYPATDHAYHPYTGNTYTITIGQTVYGGHLDVLTGKLVVDWSEKIFSGDASESWYKLEPHNYFSTARISDAINVNAAADNFKSNLYPYGAVTNTNATLGGCLIWGGIRVRLADMSISLDDWKNMLSETPLQVCYRLATPITIQLDPVTISTIAHQTNNVWADAGSVDVTFAADIKAYIDSKIAALAAQIVNS